MTITYLKKLEHDKIADNGGEWFRYFCDELPKKEIHYISYAASGLTIPSSIIEFAGGFSVDDIYELMTKVNQERETGTLYPKANISLLPLPSMRSRFGLEPGDTFNDGDYSNEQIVSHILDAFKADTRYIKSNKMYFDFRYIIGNESQYISCLELAFNEYHSQNNLPNIVTWST